MSRPASTPPVEVPWDTMVDLPHEGPQDYLSGVILPALWSWTPRESDQLKVPLHGDINTWCTLFLFPYSEGITRERSEHPSTLGAIARGVKLWATTLPQPLSSKAPNISQQCWRSNPLFEKLFPNLRWKDLYKANVFRILIFSSIFLQWLKCLFLHAYSLSKD